MESIIKVKTEGYDRYEEVLFRRDRIEKEAERYNLDYIREFGDLIMSSFELKVECIQKKKMISFCQMMENQGEDINKHDLDSFIEKEMTEYNKELERMIQDVKNAKQASPITEAEHAEIKKIYHELAKLIHPDIHPELSGDEVLADFWKSISIAYKYNHLDELKSLEFQVKRYLEDYGMDEMEIDIPDIEDKIKEVELDIERIMSSVPYTYKFLLEDPDAVEDYKNELKEEIASYEKYSDELDEVLEGFNIEEMLS